MERPEVGWFPLTCLQKQNPLAKQMNQQTVFHWHSYMFDIPKTAIHLASSERCPNQAFQCDNGIGLQFHPEVTPLLVDKYLKGEDEFLAAVGVSADEILSQTKHCHSQKSILKLCLQGFAWPFVTIKPLFLYALHVFSLFEEGLSFKKGKYCLIVNNLVAPPETKYKTWEVLW